MKKKLIVANWKMNGDIGKISHDLKFYLTNPTTNLGNVIFALPFPYLYLASNSPHNFQIASQDISRFDKAGAYTGEVSALMLKEFDVKYSIIGHSERRIKLIEDDSILLKKLENAINNEIIPIFCIGEHLEIRESSQYTEFLTRELGLLVKVNTLISELVIAYEPVWAIGSGKIPNVGDISEIANLINTFVQKTLPHAKISILYGGSVTQANAKGILQIPEISGVLVGGASLNLEEYTAICACA